MNPYGKYLENQILSATPEQILLMLYDGAIRFTRQAIDALEAEDLPGFFHGVSKSMAIITEFSNSLDHTIGGTIAEDLEALYDFMARELSLANLHKDIEKLRVVETLLVDLRATWGEAIEINKQEKVANKQDNVAHKQENAVGERVVSTPKKLYASAMPDNYVPLSICR